MRGLAVEEHTASLTVEVGNGFPPLAPDQWRRLFPDHPDPPELVQLTALAGIDGFRLRYLLIRDGEAPLLLLPVVEGRYPIATTLEGKARELMLKVEPYLPDLCQPRILIVGFVEGEWGQVGIDSHIPASTLDRAWIKGLGALDNLAREASAAAIAFWQFTQKTIEALPAAMLRDYCLIPGQPFCQLPLHYESLEEYLTTLDHDMRRYLRRALESSHKVRIERTACASTLIDRIYKLYLDQVGRSQMMFGVQSCQYFADVCDVVPGAHYVLYWLESRLIGFELLIRSPRLLISKYFAMEKEHGRAVKLYFLSWLENIRFCIDNRIPVIHVGAAAEGLKARLGGQLLSSAVILKHRNPLVNALVRRLKDDIGYEAEVAIPPVSFVNR